MRILIDLQGAQNGSRHRGIGRYSLGLAKGIARNAGEHKVFVLLNGLFADTTKDVLEAFAGLLPRERFLSFVAPGPVSALTPENLWRQRTAEVLREHIIDSLAPDVVLVTSVVEGSMDDTVTSIGTLQSTVPTAAVLYDLIPLADPDRYIGWEPAKLWYHDKIDSLRRADFLFAISQSSANEAIALLAVDRDRITNISSAAEDHFSAASASPAEVTAVTERLGITRPYLMHSSAFEARKNFQGLIRAFAALPTAVRNRHQLVLVCKLDALQRKELDTLSESLGLGDTDVVLTGFVPDADLVPLYVGCHLFVFPSFHEGFGLPPLEAMSCGTPTIGSNTTSVPEVIGRADALFDPASVPEITALILKALTDAGFYRSLKSHAAEQSRRFSWDQSALRALAGLEQLVKETALQQANVDPATPASQRRNMLAALSEIARGSVPNDVETFDLARAIETNDLAATRLKASADFGGPQTWRLEGPFDSTYSLALLNRETARALEALGHRVALHSTEGPGDFPANPAFLQLHPDLDAMHRQVTAWPHERADAVSRNLYPPRVQDMRGRINLMHHYAWEESGFPPDWVDAFNDHLDGLTCLSTHVEKVLLDNGVRVPMATSGCGVDHWERIAPSVNYRIAGRGFRFLHVSSCFPRKGVDVLLEAYGKAFTSADDVSLIVKTFANPHNEIHAMLAERRAVRSDYPHVEVLEGDLSDSDLKALYQQCHVLVAPSRAEGFGLPMAEAMLSGLPVITTAWSGQLDFCTEETAWLVDYRFELARSHFGLFDSVWANPDVGSLAQTMGTVCGTAPALRMGKAQAGRKLLLDNFQWRDAAARLVVAATGWPGRSVTPRAPRVGWVTTWNTKCGVASYSDHLIAQLPMPVTVLAPHQQGKIREDGPECVRSWYSSKDENGFDELAMQISQRDLNTLVIQFNYGFYNFRQLARFLHEQANAGRALIVVLHSTGDPGLPPEWNWALAELVPALLRCDRLLVHAVADLNRLKALGLVGNAALFPHGVVDVAESGFVVKAAQLPMIASYGYCLPHKGLVELVQAVGLLRDAGTPVRLRLVNAEYPAAESARTVAQIRETITALSLEDFVETHHAYLADSESLRLLQEADLIAYPYQQTNESASGAVRYGMAARRPVAVTPISIFDDLGDAVHRFAGIGPKELARGLSRFLGTETADRESAGTVASNAEQWRSAHVYSRLAGRLAGICTALSRATPPIGRKLDGSNRQLRSAVGQPSGRSLISTGTAGYLMFGPNWALPAGRYRALVQGRRRLGQQSACTFDIVIDNGTSVIMESKVTGNSESIVVDAGFVLERACQDLELRLVVDEQADIRIDSIQLDPVLLLT